MKTAPIIMMLLCLSSPALAGTANPKLTEYLRTQISSMEDALDGSSELGDGTPAASFDEAWYYRRFWLRVRAPFGFEIPEVLKIQVVPEVELLWERQLPDGWSTYRP